jgi:peptide/nickel transport system ATP-binding protein
VNAVATTPLLEAQGLSQHFPIRGGVLQRTVGQVRAVTDVDLALLPGEVLGLVGESGCGKTTLARLLTGLQQPTAGRLLYQGRDRQAMSDEERRLMSREVQTVFQDPYASLNPRQRVHQILSTPFDIHGLPAGPERERRIAELMQLVGLSTEHLSRYPHEFSGGQRQRIGIARALALQPKVLVLDEPLSALDMSIQSQVLNLLVELQQRLRLSYVFISHDLSVVQYLCDRVAVMYLGRVVEMAPAAELFAAPRHPYTQSLLQAAPQPDPRRRLAGTLADTGLEGDVPSPSKPPPGCAFHPRCTRAVARCRTELPVLRPVGAATRAACHLLQADSAEALIA